MVFEFRSDIVDCSDDGEELSGKAHSGDIEGGEVRQTGVLDMIRGVLASLVCTTNSGTRQTRTMSPSTESRDLRVLRGRERKQRNLSAEEDLKRLMKSVTAKSQRHMRELWLTDHLDDGLDSNRLASMQLQQWSPIFMNCRLLVRLDLAAMSLESDHLPAVLDAAGAQCANLEELVMPQQEYLVHRKRSIEAVLRSFHAALKSLNELSSPASSGLRRLVLPWVYPCEYLDTKTMAIGEHCPLLQQIVGLRLAAFVTRRRLSSFEMRTSSLHSWEAFCKGCSQLVSLDWSGLPCSVELFDIFALYPKPELMSLVLPGNVTLWRRDYAFQERNEIEPMSSSNTFDPVLQACPNLTFLKVLMSDQRGNGQMLLLGDNFLEHLVVSCPLVERLALVEASAKHGFGPSNEFTNNGIQTLASLPDLRVVDFNGINCSGETLLLLATSSHAINQPRNRVDVTLGVRGAAVIDVVAQFNKAILEVGSILLSPEARRNPAFVIRLRIDTHNYSLPTRWETCFSSRWRQLQLDLMRSVTNVRFYYDLMRAEATFACHELIE